MPYLFHRFFAIILLALFCSYNCFSKDKNISKVNPQDFKVELGSSDKGLIFFNDCTITFEGNAKGWFNVIYRYNKRLLITKRDALDEANLSFYLYHDGSDKETLKLSAKTFNLVGEEIVEKKLPSENKFAEVYNSNYNLVKCHLPDVREGSIIEFEAIITSPFINTIRNFQFQSSDFPTRKASLHFAIPDFFEYISLSRGGMLFDTSYTEESSQVFSVSDSYNAGLNRNMDITTKVFTRTWEMNNQKAVDPEPYVYSMENIITGLGFHLKSISLTGQARRMILPTWDEVYQTLYEHEKFGKVIRSKIDVEEPEIKPESKLQLAEHVYSKVKSLFTAKDGGGVFLTDKLSSIVRTQSGTATDINLVLVAALRTVNLSAEPVLVSTRDHAYPVTTYPIITSFNYVIAQVLINDMYYFLDASNPKLYFGQLPSKCYNGNAMVYSIENKTCKPVSLNANQLVDEIRRFANISVSEDLNYTCSYTETGNEYQSFGKRVSLDGEKAKKDFITDRLNMLNLESTLISKRFSGLSNDDSLYVFSMNQKGRLPQQGDKVYLTINLNNPIAENDFNRETRIANIEFDSKLDLQGEIKINIPASLVLEEIPAPRFISALSDVLFAEIVCTQKDNAMIIQYKIQVNATNFPVDAYGQVKSFFKELNKNLKLDLVFKKN